MTEYSPCCDNDAVSRGRSCSVATATFIHVVGEFWEFVGKERTKPGTRWQRRQAKILGAPSAPSLSASHRHWRMPHPLARIDKRRMEKFFTPFSSLSPVPGHTKNHNSAGLKRSRGNPNLVESSSRLFCSQLKVCLTLTENSLYPPVRNLLASSFVSDRAPGANSVAKLGIV